MEEVKPKMSNRNRKTLQKCVQSGVMTYDEARSIEKSMKRSQYRVASSHKTREMEDVMVKMWSVAEQGGEIDAKLLKRQLMTLETLFLPKPDLSIPDSVNNVCRSYFSLCVEKNEQWTLAGLLLALGISRNEFMKILNGEKLRNTQPVLQQAYQLLNAQFEAEAMNGKINPMIVAYIGNNNFGYSDKKEVKVITNKTEDLSDEELQRKYIDVEVEDK